MAETKVTENEISKQGWIAPTLLNSWVNYGNPYTPVGYMKDAMGFVHIKGFVKSGASGASVFTLPAGYRPAVNGSIYGVCNAGAGHGDIVIEQGTGNVTVYNVTAGSNVSIYASLNISFMAEA